MGTYVVQMRFISRCQWNLHNIHCWNFNAAIFIVIHGICHKVTGQSIHYSLPLINIILISETFVLLVVSYVCIKIYLFCSYASAKWTSSINFITRLWSFLLQIKFIIFNIQLKILIINMCIGICSHASTPSPSKYNIPNCS